MNQSFKAVILSCKKAPLEIRERLALDETACRRLLRTLCDELRLHDVLVLSTGTRTEVYYSASHDYSTAIIAELGQLTELADIPRYQHYFTSLTWADDAVEHLFEVALGLEAPLAGDEQVSIQVKQAYQWSADAAAAGPFLHRLLHTIFFTQKRVEQQTGFQNDAASASVAAVPPVRAIVAESMAELSSWSSEMEFSGTIGKQLRQEELRRFGKKLLPAEAGMMDELTRALVQKVLQQPVQQLQAACRRGETGPLLDVLTELFDLEKQPAAIPA